VVAFPAATRSGGLIIAEVDFSAASNFISLSDSQGNLYQQVGTEQQSTSFGIKSRLYYAANIRGGADTVTVVVSGTPAYHEVYLHEYAGLDLTAPLDAFSVRVSTGTTFSSGTVTTTANHDLLYGIEIDSQGATAASGWTTRSTMNSNVAADQDAPSPGTYAFTGRSGGAFIAWIAAFKLPTGTATVSSAGSAVALSDRTDTAFFKSAGATSGDFDGDSKADPAVYRPTTGEWLMRLSSCDCRVDDADPTRGHASDVPLAADFDGDGKADRVVYRPDDGTWYVRFSSTNYTTSQSYHWGSSGDIPLVADFDGDGKADFVVYRPSDGTWHVRLSSSQFGDGPPTSYRWGLAGDVPIAADFDGDGKTDLAIYRPSSGTWHIRFSSSNYANSTSYQWGAPGDRPLIADFDGDGKADLVVYRPSNGAWYVRFSSSDFSDATTTAYRWGLPGDIPLPNDFDGDGKTDLSVYRPSTGEWFIAWSSSRFDPAAWSSYQIGAPGDVPIFVTSMP
jgi:hypothetical protein